MEIPPIIFIAVGILIGVISYFSKMYYFIVAAVGFVAWGFFKIIRNRASRSLLGPDETKKEEKEPITSEKTQDTVPCPNCGLKHYSHANYCQNCGTKLK